MNKHNQLNIKKLSQSGFGAIEALLIIVIIGVIGGAGFYVYKAKQTTDKSLNNPVSSTVEKVKTQTTASVEKTTDNATKVQYMEIKEWGVKVPIDSSVSGLSYVLDNSSNQVKKDSLIRFSSDDLKKNSTQKDCYSNQVYLERGKSSDKMTTGNDPDTNETFKQVYDKVAVDPNETNARAVKAMVGDYYYVPPNFGGASCSSNETEANNAFKANANIIKALLKMEKL